MMNKILKSLGKTVRTMLIAGTVLSVTVSGVFAADSYASMSGIGSARTHKYSGDEYIIIDGIDVSAYNSELTENDWLTLKKKGIDFAFIRTSGTYYGRNLLAMYDDHMFDTHYDNAKKAGMMVGTYHYTAAATTAEAEKEAARSLKVIGGKELDLPIVFDSECNEDRCLNLRFHGERRINNALAFNRYIKTRTDYSTMYYSYLNMMNSEPGFQTNVSRLLKEMPIWIAQYTDTNTYKGEYSFWQHTCNGYFDYGRIGPLDCNFWYFRRDSKMINSVTGNSCTVKADITKKYYKGYPLKTTLTVTDGDQVLTEGVDYKVNFVKNVKVGKGYAIVTGTGNYSGQAAAQFSIVKESLSKAEISGLEDSYPYTGFDVTPKPTVTIGSKTLVEGKDYTVSYSDNLDAGTATVTVKGKGIYTGSSSAAFRITPAPLDPDRFKVSSVPFTGKPVETVITTDYQNKDYTVTYENNSEPGTATAIITGKGNCTGESFTKEFRIYLPAPAKVTPVLYGMDDVRISWSRVTGANKYVVYFKTSKMLNYRKLTTTSRTSYDFPNLIDGEKYSFKVVPYRRVNGENIQGKYRINSIYTLKKMSKPAVTKSGSYVKISWEKVNGADGYEISKSTSRYKTNPAYDFRASSVCSRKISARKNVTYYYKIRAYKKYGSKKIYSTWSAVKPFRRY